MKRDRRHGSAGASRVRRRTCSASPTSTPDEIALILDTAEAMKEIGERPIKKVPTLRGRTVVNLFFEPSTRTRTSFEIAEKRLSADTLNIAIATSSVIKGETLVDTALNLEAMSPGHDRAAPRLVGRAATCWRGSAVARSSTPATACTSTRRRRCSTRSRSASTRGRLDGLKVAIVGDLLHSRVLRSNVLLLTKLGADVWVCGPPTLMPPGIERLRRRASTTSVDEAVADADVVMMLRIQHERMQGALLPVAARVLQRCSA